MRTTPETPTPVQQNALHNSTEAIDQLTRLVAERRLLVLTGAGCSTESGIPDYRDEDGGWKRKPPVQYQEFVASAAVRRRYWARSLIGWRPFSRARPGPAHRALARLQRGGRIGPIVTQNVDRLHQSAGSPRVVDLHGRLDTVVCLDCGVRSFRERLQADMEQANPEFADLSAAHAPDGDALLEGADFGGFRVPDCDQCGGLLKPDVVFFGESVPRPRVEQCMTALDAADGLLVVGSSLMVYSGFRFARAAVEQGKPVAAINMGRTRADGELSLKVNAPCGAALRRVAEQLAAATS